VRVSDSVFVAITNNHYHRNSEGFLSSPEIYVRGFFPGGKDEHMSIPGQTLANLWHQRINNVDTMYWRLMSSYSNPRLFLYPIIAQPSSDTVTADSLILHPGNSLVVTPGSTLVVEGDTLVVTDSLVIPLGDTVVIAGHPFVVNPGDTLVVGTGDTLVVGPDGSVTVLPGGTLVVHSGSGSSSGGDDPGVAIRQTDIVYRYTAVAPNPALDRATVTSSFGISRLEAYDAQGRLVYDSHNLSTFSFQLSTVEWPRGTYLLRITTPLGPTTKKLIVR
jgi:hypothetical protein